MNGEMRRREQFQTMDRLLEWRARSTPDRLAYVLLNEELVPEEIHYGRLHARAEALAAWLHTCGIGPGVRCLLMFPQGLGFIVALLACHKAGAVPVPVNRPARNKPLRKWERIAGDCRPAAIVAAAGDRAALRDIMSGSAVLSALPILVEEPDKASGGGCPGFSELAFLQYTSGSTGDPKGVMVTHTSLFSNLRQLEARFSLNGGSVMVSWLPFYHDMGLILGILQGIYSGYPVVLMKPADFMQQPLNWLKAISRYEATHTGAPNFAYELAAEKLCQWSPDGEEQLSLASLKRAICGAEAVHPGTLRKFGRTARRFGLGDHVLAPGFGLAEATLVVSAYAVGEYVGCLKLDRESLRQGKVRILERGALADVRMAGEDAVKQETGRESEPDTVQEMIQDAVQETAQDASGNDWQPTVQCTVQDSAQLAIQGKKQLAIRDLKQGAPDARREIELAGNGFVIDGHELSVRQRQSGEELGGLMLGEVCFAGPSVTKGYWNRPEESGSAYMRDHSGKVWLHTGDLGFLDHNGELYIAGRIKELIVIRGMNYYPQDIERTAFEAVPELRTDGGAAFSVQAEGSERLVLIQEVNRPAARRPDCEGWARRVRAAVLAVHGIETDTIVFIPPLHLPRTTSGKIQRNRAKERYESGELGKVLGISVIPGGNAGNGLPVSAASVGSREELAELLAALVGGHLAAAAGLERDRSFTELGVNSVMSLSISDELERSFGFRLSAADLFNYNTLHALSGHLWERVQAARGLNAGSSAGELADVRAGNCDTELENLSEEELLELLKKELGDTDHVY